MLNSSTLNVQKLLFFLWKPFLDLVYLTLLYPWFNFLKYPMTNNPFMLVLTTISWFYIYEKFQEEEHLVSNFYIKLLLFFKVAPFFTYISFQPLDNTNLACFVIYFVQWMVIHYFYFNKNAFFDNKISLLKKYSISGNFSLFLYVILIATIINLTFITYKYFNLNIMDVYKFRNIIAESLPKHLNYLTSWMGKVIIPLLCVWSLIQKKKIQLLFLIFISFLLFALTSHKFYLLTAILPIAVFYVYNSKIKKYFFNLILYGACIASLIPLYLSEIFKSYSIIIPSLFIRRAIFEGAKIDNMYLTFFQNNPHVYFSNGILKRFINYPYNAPIQEIIAKELEQDGGSTNTSFFATSFMHLSFGGPILFPIIFIFILKLLNIAQENYKKYYPSSSDAIIITATLPVMLTLIISSDLPTTLLNHGLIIALILLVLARPPFIIQK